MDLIVLNWIALCFCSWAAMITREKIILSLINLAFAVVNLLRILNHYNLV